MNDLGLDNSTTATAMHAVDDIGLELGDFMPLMTTLLPVNHDGSFVHLAGWPVAKALFPPILLVHDLDEQSDSYHFVATKLSERQYSVYAYDLRGHGRSGNILGHVADFNQHINDLLQVAAWIKHIELGRAPILVGQGLGALIVIEFAKKYGHFCTGLVLASPYMDLVDPPSAFGVWVLRLARELWSTLRPPRFFYPNFVAKRLGPSFTVAYMSEILAAIRRVEVNFIEYHGNVLILCPKIGEYCNYAHLKKSAAVHAEYNLTIVDIPEAKHHIFAQDSVDFDLTLKAIELWLKNHDFANLSPTSKIENLDLSS